MDLTFAFRENHDNFAGPSVGGAFNFFSKYSINGPLEMRQNVNSITLQTGGHKYLLIGFDNTMSIGLWCLTNRFGHFPLSFSTSSYSGKSLKDIFLEYYSLSTNLCEHLHTRHGKNSK